MRPPRLIETTELAIESIDRTQRLRPVSQKSVEGLIASIEQIGLQSEIQVRRIKKSGKLKLLAGGHRCEAYLQMGRAAIPAKIWECTDDQAALIEIDDNLAHAEMDMLELAVFLARRKAVYERMYPAAKRGSAGGRAKNEVLTDNVSVSSFAASAAEKLGVSERKIFRLLAAGTALGAAEIQDLRAAPRKVTIADLQVIAKCAQPVDRYDICRALRDGTARSAHDALALRNAVKKPAPNPVDDALKRLNDAFSRAPMEARRRFVAANADALGALLGDAP